VVAGLAPRLASGLGQQHVCQFADFFQHLILVLDQIVFLKQEVDLETNL
jgi:hypothetical protein